MLQFIYFLNFKTKFGNPCVCSLLFLPFSPFFPFYMNPFVPNVLHPSSTHPPSAIHYILHYTTPTNHRTITGMVCTHTRFDTLASKPFCLSISIGFLILGSPPLLQKYTPPLIHHQNKFFHICHIYI